MYFLFVQLYLGFISAINTTALCYFYMCNPRLLHNNSNKAEWVNNTTLCCPCVSIVFFPTSTGCFFKVNMRYNDNAPAETKNVQFLFVHHLAVHAPQPSVPLPAKLASCSGYYSGKQDCCSVMKPDFHWALASSFNSPFSLVIFLQLACLLYSFLTPVSCQWAAESEQAKRLQEN